MRARGLKYDNIAGGHITRCVVPHAGTWIEILVGVGVSSAVKSCPMRARGLKSNIL